MFRQSFRERSLEGANSASASANIPANTPANTFANTSANTPANTPANVPANTSDIISTIIESIPTTNSGWNLANTIQDNLTSPFSEYSAVVVGGGTGAPVSIKTLLAMGVKTSAVVAMTDDGGSTGLIRERADAIPPGDIRKCITAMARDSRSPLVEAFRYRFDYALNHTLGNLMITALADVASFPEAIEICERILDVRGHVFPSTIDSIVLAGLTRDGRYLHGQSTIAHSDTAIERVWIDPSDPNPYPQAIQAILKADMIVLGPGSLFTSIIPNLLVPGIVEAIKQSGAVTVFLCSLADMQGETWGLDCHEHVRALLDHGMEGLLDVVCVSHPQGEDNSHTREFEAVTPLSAQSSLLANSPSSSRVIRSVQLDDAIRAAIAADVPVIVERRMVDSRFPTWHSPRALAEVFKGVLDLCRSRGR